MSNALRTVLLGGDGLRLDEWRRTGRLTVIKESQHRGIYRVCLPDLDLHIKQYRRVGLRGWLRELIRPNKARREARLAQAIRARGIRTPEPLGWADGGIITRTEHGDSLLNFIESRANEPPLIHRFATALGRFLASLHAAGVVHHDPHPGNLIVDCRGDEPQFALLDLHAVRLGPPCSWVERRENLILFNRFFMLRASRAERLRFWRAYCDASGSLIGLPADQAGREVERRTLESNLQFWTARDRRCLVSNRYYRRVSNGGVRGFVVRDLDSSLVAELLRDPDQPFRDAPAKIKDSRSSTVIEFPAAKAIFKRFRVTNARDPWLALFRRTPVIRSWIMGQGLRERCLPTARPLAVLHRYRNGLPREGYLLTEKIENAIELRAWADRMLTRPAEERRLELRDRIPALARLIRQLHERGLAHRDLKAANILTSERAGDPRFWFIDLVGVRRMSINAKRRAQNLARLLASFAEHPLVSRTDRLRFLRSYQAWALRGKAGWKKLWRRIESAWRTKIERNRRTGRPIA
jgi:tRNA A-37 threonylcarbamoyl transferase component Bud32